MNFDKFVNLCKPVARLVERKGKDYQGNIFSLHDSFPLGDVSYAQMLWVKVVRITSLAHRKSFDMEHEPNHESLEDSVKDLLAYTVFYLDYLEAERINKECKEGGDKQ